MGVPRASFQDLGGTEHGQRGSVGRVEEMSQMELGGTVIINGKGKNLCGKMNVFGGDFFFFKDHGPSRCR